MISFKPFVGIRSKETSMLCDHIVNNNDQNTPLSVNSSIENRNNIKLNLPEPWIACMIKTILQSIVVFEISGPCRSYHSVIYSIFVKTTVAKWQSEVSHNVLQRDCVTRCAQKFGEVISSRGKKFWSILLFSVCSGSCASQKTANCSWLL